jgi:hypothetical protein
LKQVVLDLITSSDGDIPLLMRAGDVLAQIKPYLEKY